MLLCSGYGSGVGGSIFLIMCSIDQERLGRGKERGLLGIKYEDSWRWGLLLFGGVEWDGMGWIVDVCFCYYYCYCYFHHHRPLLQIYQ